MMEKGTQYLQARKQAELVFWPWEALSIEMVLYRLQVYVTIKLETMSEMR